MKHAYFLSLLIAIPLCGCVASGNRRYDKAPLICEPRPVPTSGEAPFSPSADAIRQAEIAPLTFYRPIRGMGPTPLAPSVVNELPIEQDIKWGRESVNDWKNDDLLVRDVPLEAYLNDRMQELLAVAPEYAQAFPPHIFLYRDPNVHNAYATGGGYVFVGIGRIAYASCEDCLMHDLGHELGHNALRHGTGRYTFERILNMQITLLEKERDRMEVKTDPERFKLVVLALERLRRNLPEDKRFQLQMDELAADVFGIQLLHKAGYDTGAVTREFWKQSLTFEYGLENWSAHPHDATRALRMDLERDELAKTPVRARQKDPARFARVQARAKALAEGKKELPPL